MHRNKAFGGRKVAGYRPLTAADEAELYARLKRGDVDARNELIERGLPFFIRLVDRWKRMIEPDEALSVVTVSLCRNADKWDPRRGKFLTWAGRIGSYAISRHLTAQRTERRGAKARHVRACSPICDHREPRPADEAARREEARAVRDTLRRLGGPGRRDVAAMSDRHMLDESYAELAERFGFSKQRAQQLVTRSERRFRNLWPSEKATSHA